MILGGFVGIGALFEVVTMVAGENAIYLMVVLLGIGTLFEVLCRWRCDGMTVHLSKHRGKVKH